MTPPLKILAVEHDLPLLALYEALLTKRGHSVVRTRTGPEAASYLSDGIDVVIVDLRSTKSMGREILEAIQATEPEFQVPVLIVDGNEAASALVKGPHTMVMRKPFGFERFVEAIESLAMTGERRGRN